MDPEAVFSACNSLALVGWALLLVAPRWRWSARLVSGFAIPLALAAIYATLIVARWAGHRGGFGSLAGVEELFADRWLLLAGWVHYLAFDLFIGSWEVRDAAREGVPRWLVAPCLVLTFLLGPAGLLVYLAIASARRSLARRRGPTPAATINAT